MNRVIVIAMTQFKMVVRSKSTLAMMFALPLLFTFLFGAAIDGGGSSIKKTPLVLVDYDQTFASKAYIAALRSDKSLAVDVTDKKAMDRSFMDRKVASGVVIPKGFQESLGRAGKTRIELINTPDAAGANVAIKPVVQGALAEVASSYSLSQRIEGGNKYQRVVEARKDMGVVVESTPVKPAVEDKDAKDSPSASETSERSVGFSVMFVMMLVFNMGGFLLKERRQGTWGRLLTAPADRFSILCGYVLSFFITGMFQFSVLLITTTALFKVSWGPILPLLAIASAYTLCSAGLGIFVAGIVKTVEQQSALGILVVNATSMLGGAYWSLDFVSPIMRRIGYMTPQAWAMDGFREVMLRGANWGALVLPLAVLLAFSAIFMSVGLMRIRFEA